MHSTSSLRNVSRSPRSRTRRHPILVGAFALAALVGSSGIATHTVSAANRVPQAVDGDPHSPTVARLAAVALDAKSANDRTGTVADQRHYEATLGDVAAATAFELGFSRLEVEQAWTAADSVHQTAVLSALTQLGVEYQSNTSEPFVGFDCSGLTTFAWAEAGVQLSRQSGSQISEAEERSPDTAMAGDLVQFPGHVMMYLGVPNAVVHSANPESDVELWLLGDRSVRYGDPTE